MLYPKSKQSLVALVSVIGLWISSAWAPAQDQPAKGKPNLTCAEMEQFLRDAKIGRQRDIPKGVTLPKRATLTSDDGRMVHDASIQTIHESKTAFTTLRGSELNFKDWWEFNFRRCQNSEATEHSRSSRRSFAGSKTSCHHQNSTC